MSIPVLTSGATGLCPHGGQLRVISTGSRVRISGIPVIAMKDQCIVAGCPSTRDGHPAPCVNVEWTGSSSRVLISGQPVLQQTSDAMALRADRRAAGPMLIVAGQARVTAI